MIHLNEIELYFEPRNKILPLLPTIEGEPEMSPFDSAFLCGLIRKFKPDKIVEVGIAGGGSTAIILSCVQMLKLDKCNIYSIDYSEKFYRDNTLTSGYLGGLALELLSELKDRHRFLLGDIACSWCDELKDCDFLILDTTHFLPGEVLDFITLLPVLKDGAVVVFHDIRLNQMRNKSAIATGTCISASTGEKYINWDESAFGRYPNIGAIVVNEDTRKNIANLFLSLLLTWTYLPSEKQIAGYRKAIVDFYNNDLVQIFDCALELNKRTYWKNKSESNKETEKTVHLFPFNRVRTGARVVLFGAGEVGKSYKQQIDRLKYCDVVKWVDSLYQKIGVDGVTSPDAINDVEYDFIVIATVKEEYAKEIQLNLLDLGVAQHKIIWENPII